LEYEASITFTVNIILLISTIVLIILKTSILLISIVFLLSRVIGFIASVFFAKKVQKDLRFEPIFRGFADTWKKVLTFGLFLLFNNLFFQIDTILLGIWKGDYEVGVYQSVFKLILLPLIIPDIFTNALMPTLSRLFSSNIEKWEKTGFLLNKLFTALIMPIAILLFVYSEQIVNLLYGGDKYQEAIPVLKILSVTMFLRFSFESFSLMLTTSNRMSIRMWSVISATFLNIGLNYFFINRYGALGASIVSLISNTFVLLIYLFFLRNLFYKWIVNINQIMLYVFSFIVFIIFLSLENLRIYMAFPLILLIFFLYLYVIYFSKIEKSFILSSEMGITFFRK
ncbi:MAG: oligosaccharide flippase family protein, partial [Ignavibacteria bacterium]|nr:oligosaccharide flippase family protein [Ignavibacteria bacterium]